MSNYITTYTGRQFEFENPQPEMIHIDDIAHALSMLCHWNGQCRDFFSVAQHSILVSYVVNQNDIMLMKWGLLHDASEAYLGDVSRPLKLLLPEYKFLERRTMLVIAKKFELSIGKTHTPSWPVPEELKEYDNQILKMEANALMPAGALHDGEGNPIDVSVGTKLIKAYTAPWHHENAEGMFLQRYKSLFQC